MKHLLLAALLACSLSPVLAQTSQADQYCILEARAHLKDRAGLKLLAGADPAKTGQVEEVQQVTSFEYEADALNYLSVRGWEVIGVTSTISNGDEAGTRYYLRRRKS